MRPVTVRLSAAGVSPWIPLDYIQTSFSVGLAVLLSTNGNLTYSVQHTSDELWDRTEQFTGARVTTTMSITKTNHGLRVGDWFQIQGNAAAPFFGEYAVAAITSESIFTATVANSGLTTMPLSGAWLSTARVMPHATLAALTASANGNYAFPPRACRLAVTSYTAGYVDLTVIQGHGGI